MWQEQGRVLGLDIGSRRIGVALSDPSHMLASPLTTLRAEPRVAVIEAIRKLVLEHGVQELVLGLPLTLAGEIGPQARVVQEFAEQLAAAIKIPLHFYDERLTSAAAEQIMQSMGIKPQRRRERIDEIAATIILQDFLDQRRGGSSYLLPEE